MSDSLGPLGLLVLLGFSVHGILQARILEWVAFPPPGDHPDSEIEPRSPRLLHWLAGTLSLRHLGLTICLSPVLPALCKLLSSLTWMTAVASSVSSAPVFASSPAFVHSQSRSQSDSSEKWVQSGDASNPNSPEAPVHWEPWPAVAGPLCNVSDLIFCLSPSLTPCQSHWLLGCSSNKTELHLRVSVLVVPSAPRSLPPNIHTAKTFTSYKSPLHSRLVDETTPDLLENRISSSQDSQFPFTLLQFFSPHHSPPPSILYNLWNVYACCLLSPQ